MSPRSPLLLLFVLLFVRGFSCASSYPPVEIYAQELDELPNGLFYNPSYGDYSSLTGPYLMTLIPYSQNWNGLLIDFNISCPNTTTFNIILADNLLSVPLDPSYRHAPKIAMIKRGGCLWSQKINWALSLSSTYSMNIIGVFIVDNQSTQNMTAVRLNNGTLYLNAYDNDLPNGVIQPVPTIFVDNLLGTILYHTLEATNSNKPMSFLQVTVSFYEDTSSWTTGFNATVGILLLMICCLLYYHFGRRYGWNPLKWRDEMRFERARWEARRQQRRNGNRGIELQVLKPEAIVNIPVVAYDAETIKNSTCPICLEDYAGLQGGIPENDQVERSESGAYRVRMLPCGHGFCVDCIDVWLGKKSTSCPICKFDLASPGVSIPVNEVTNEPLSSLSNEPLGSLSNEPLGSLSNEPLGSSSNE
ncbi:hypothetical protein BC937DRAFT_95411 [Endogone sp. FLAS-F59071]|nr:hypothetical protein BC937DRAFT_95411 [Endogone sp. FLAS-F59071]|eukprot:RUS13383.1 hypothetical protein BC937DRAFT_95411 [Endogone sp. FLAS-F59071]